LLYHTQIAAALHDNPTKLRREFYQTRVSNEIYTDHSIRPIVMEFMKVLEAELREQLSRHSVAYWIHLYRRIKPVLSWKHDDKTDFMTVGWVRGLVETAISKFARLETVGDVAPSTEIPNSRILGGHFRRDLRKFYRKKLKNPDLKIHLSESQYVLTKFSSKDYIGIYLCEGLAYEYWRATALLRALGKGARIRFDPNNDYVHAYIADGELEQLILSYDSRIDEFSEFATIAGASVDLELSKDLPSRILIPQYNTQSVQLPTAILEGLGISFSRESEAATNFIPVPFDLASAIIYLT